MLLLAWQRAVPKLFLLVDTSVSLPSAGTFSSLLPASNSKAANYLLLDSHELTQAL